MKYSQYLALIPVIIIIVFAALISFLGDYYWFDSVGYAGIFLNIIAVSVILGIIAAVVFFGFSYICARISLKSAANGGDVSVLNKRIVLLFCGLGALFGGLSVSSQWETVLMFLNQSPFGVLDPIFGLDAGFYVFSLPFFNLIANFVIGVVIFSIIVSFLGYLLESEILTLNFNEYPITEFKGQLKIDSFIPQLSVLLFFLFSAISARIWLARYDLLFTPGETVFGVGYTDATVTLPVMAVLTFVSFLIGIGFLINERLRRPEVIKYGVIIFIAVAVIGVIAGGVVQVLIVSPNEFNLEKPYLSHNINSTLVAYGLDDVDEKQFTVDYNLTNTDIIENSATVENIRLWDWRPLKTTYEQLQLFRTYYEFNDIDVDRYTFGDSYKQVLISAREMNIKDLPSQAQTWVNTHLVYTHGYGAVMSPVDVVSKEGLPDFYLKDIPPTSEYIELNQPGIYYGEGLDDYSVVMTKTEEFDYPSSDENIYTTYQGSGGVELSGILQRLIYAIKFKSVELLVSGSLDSDSRILMNRNILERADAVAPFLSYDSDPYVVVSEGRLFWIIDAYTSTGKFPYSATVQTSDYEEFNYLRNSAKVVIDAYNGDITYYIVNGNDPLIQAYNGIFPGAFKDFSEMPEDLRSHVRYPAGIFEIQSEVYSLYHMKDPRVFYNREDAWNVPDEVYRGSRQRMEPYYIIMKLPGEESEEFIQMLPFTPRSKENLIAWMAVRSDTPNYGGIVVYQFSKQELTYGPMQIEARIDQDTEISQDITLWSQSGSSVLRGNTLIIPIENSILYVEPLYLEATEKGTLPQLKRVIVAYGDRLTMKDTLAEALDEIFGDIAIERPVGGAGEGIGEGEEVEVLSSEVLDKLNRIAELYDSAQDALNKGDLGAYQRNIDQIGDIINS
ncbi:UPF0182 family membrane protein [Methanoplanus limicola]|uniref:UPF0182 protein Metlim_1483 n=1 Tax=Methanoplanus limicola DSM 2279 TaxID=937775 RepID=H1Z346_9EURY|nr:UPF0182 family protein [Methanoplanus limicola]EHQ35586.1 UPF0182 protein [Methanoplanus limicola DSM 2279]